MLRSLPFCFCFTALFIPLVVITFVADYLFSVAQFLCSLLNAKKCRSLVNRTSIKTKRIMRSIGGEFYASASQMFFPFEYVIYVGADEDIPNGQEYLKDIQLQMKNNKHNIIMANHILYTDWLYIWIFLLRGCDDPSSACFIMKDSLKRIPIIGRTMNFLGFLFLARNAEKDVKYLKEKIDLNKEKRSNIIIFPEGTTCDVDTLQQMRQHCDSKGYLRTRYCLFPKHTGFTTILQRENVNGVLDLTFCYEDTNYFLKQSTRPVYKYYTITSLLLGRYPKQVALRLKYYNKRDIDLNDASIKQWLNERFYEKDDFIGDIVSNEGDPKKYKIVHVVPSESKYRLLFELYFLLVAIGAAYEGVSFLNYLFRLLFNKA